MVRWEYDKLDLNNVPAKLQDVTLLNAVGRDGWEVVVITDNHMAYLKRPIVPVTPRREQRPAVEAAQLKGSGQRVRSGEPTGA